MKSIAEIRKENLKILAAKVGKAARLAEILGFENARLSMLIGKNTTRNIGEKLARRIESIPALGIEEGWLDQDHLQESGLKLEPITPDNVYSLSYLDLKSTTAQGRIIINQEINMPLPKKIIESMGATDIKQVCYTEITDDLLDPDLKIGQIVIIDMQKKNAESGKHYLIRINGNYLIRRVYLKADGTIRIAINNANKERDFPDEILTQDKFSENVTVIGKIIGDINLNH